MTNRLSLLKIAVASAGAVPVAFSFIVLTGVLREFTYAGLEGRKFLPCYSLVLSLLWVSMVGLVFAYRKKPGIARIWFWIVIGAVAGYSSGIFSATLVELFRPDRWQQVAQQSLHFKSWGIRLVYPLIALNWLIGVFAGIIGFVGLKCAKCDAPNRVK